MMEEDNNHSVSNYTDTVSKSHKYLKKCHFLTLGDVRRTVMMPYTPSSSSDSILNLNPLGSMPT